MEMQVRASLRTASAAFGVSARGMVLFLRDNRMFTAGLSIILFIVLIGLIGRLFVNEELAIIGAVPLNLKPSAAHPLGTDGTGRDVLALMVIGIPNTVKIGLLAGGIGTAVGVVFGLITGYFRGALDTLIRSFADVMFVIPGLVILITVAVFVRAVNVETMALIVALLSWPLPTRTIRAQTLSLRERAFVRMAKLSDKSDWEILFVEILPNLLPYVAATSVGAISGGILAAVGLEVLGLGPQRIPTLGGTLYWALFHAAVFRGMWWWWAPPVVILICIFLGFFLMSIGLDRVANPRLRSVARKS